MQRSKFRTALLASSILMAVPLAPSPVRAQDANYNLTIHDDRFEPGTLEVPSGVKFKLVVTNARKVAAEFESHELNREKVVPAGKSVTINVGPLKPGTYSFFDDFRKSTKGQMIVK